MVVTAGKRRVVVPVRLLCEDAGQTGRRRVDRQRGIIYGAKLVGRFSPNQHGTGAVDGTEYPLGTLREAMHLYEGLPVNINHPERDSAGRPAKKDRSSYDRLGVVRNVRLNDDGLYADLHILRSHPMFDRVMEAAETEGMSGCYALSHNAYGAGAVKNGRYVVNRLAEVRSVDLVADGGTNRGLFESARRPGTSRPGRTVAERVKLLEAKERAYGLRDRLRRLAESSVGDRASVAGSLARRLSHIIKQLGLGHSCTYSDMQTIKEAVDFLAQLDPDDAGDAEAMESAVPRSPAEQLRWLREGRPPPAPVEVGGNFAPAAVLRLPPADPPRVPREVSRAAAGGDAAALAKALGRATPAQQLAWLLG